MRKYIVVAVAMVAIGLLAQATSLKGKTITVKAGDWISRDVPLAIPAPGADVERIVAMESTTGKQFPAAVHDGVLYLVSEGAMPGTEHHYVIAAHPLGEDLPTPVQLVKQEGKDIVDVIIQGIPFTAYHYSNDNKKPFLWPVYGEGGVTVTRNWPMGESEGSEDHPHQKSLWTGYGDVNNVDCWGEGKDSGSQQSGEVTWGSNDAFGWIKAANAWLDNAGKSIISEAREYRFYPGKASARLIDVKVTFTADHGDALFEDTKEGGIVSVRVRPEIQGNKNGNITNALGGSGEKECWGKASPWCDYSGPIEGYGVRGIAVMDHPTNLRHPSRWHVRDYGLMGANVFGLQYFTDKKENGDYTLKSGETLEFNYRVLIHSGDSAEADVAARYADFATPPSASLQ